MADARTLQCNAAGLINQAIILCWCDQQAMTSFGQAKRENILCGELGEPLCT